MGGCGLRTFSALEENRSFSALEENKGQHSLGAGAGTLTQQSSDLCMSCAIPSHIGSWIFDVFPRCPRCKMYRCLLALLSTCTSLVSNLRQQVAATCRSGFIAGFVDRGVQCRIVVHLELSIDSVLLHARKQVIEQLL